MIGVSRSVSRWKKIGERKMKKWCMNATWRNNCHLVWWIIARVVVLAPLLLLFLLTGHVGLFLLGITMVFVMVIRKVRPSLEERWSYFQDNPSGAYILSFIVLIMFGAFLLIFEIVPVAEQIANVAYFLLAIGVGIEFVRILRERNNIKDKNGK